MTSSVSSSLPITKVSVHNDFSQVTYRVSLDNHDAHSYPLPSTWEKHAGTTKRVVVPTGSSEYNSVASQFTQSIQGHCQQIVRIERIQNARSYMQYVAHSKDFSDRLRDDTERRLFHGCPHTAADAIIDDCFNRSYAGVNGEYRASVHVDGNGLFDLQGRCTGLGCISRRRRRTVMVMLTRTAVASVACS